MRHLKLQEPIGILALLFAFGVWARLYIGESQVGIMGGVFKMLPFLEPWGVQIATAFYICCMLGIFILLVYLFSPIFVRIVYVTFYAIPLRLVKWLIRVCKRSEKLGDSPKNLIKDWWRQAKNALIRMAKGEYK